MSFGNAIRSMIERRGRTVTFRRTNSGEGTYDPTTDAYTPPGTPDEATPKAIITGVSMDMVKAESGILMTDKRVVIAPIAWEPKQGDVIVDGSTTLKIVSVAKKVSVGDDLIGWVFIGRA